MRASLVIPTLNAAKELPALLETVQAQTVELEEVLVVDSSSKDGTSDVAKRFGARTLSIPRSEFDHGGTRHAALMETSGDRGDAFQLACCSPLPGQMDAS